MGALLLALVPAAGRVAALALPGGTPLQGGIPTEPAIKGSRQT
jgi:hypothetical protein